MDFYNVSKMNFSKVVNNDCDTGNNMNMISPQYINFMKGKDEF